MDVQKDTKVPDNWPPSFTLDQEKILKLLTGDRFYSNASAALREAILNAIDAVQRRQFNEHDITPSIVVQFNRDKLTLSVEDNGDGMDRDAVTRLFTRVGASASQMQAGQGSVGEFGIGVISYFMAADSFCVQSFNGFTEPIGLNFTSNMLVSGAAEILEPNRDTQGTTIIMNIRDKETFELLLKSFPHWCRDVSGLKGFLLSTGEELRQGGCEQIDLVPDLVKPEWIENAYLAPVSGPHGWDSMSGESTISVLYRGIFVQDFTVRGLWGIKGTIDVDPKHFKPRLNREGFVEGAFKIEVEQFLKQSHPKILLLMADRLAKALVDGSLEKWTQRRWATLWLSIPRGNTYLETTQVWDEIFRNISAFERAVGNKWEPITLKHIMAMEGSIYIAPLPDEKQKQTDVINAALRLLRHTGKNVIRGLRPDRSWLQYAGNSFGTTADLIFSVFADQLPELLPLANHAEDIIMQVEPLVTLFPGNPCIDLVRIGSDSPPVIRLKKQLLINLDHSSGKTIIEEVLTENTGRWSLISITARHSQEHISQVAAAIRDSSLDIEALGLLKRRYIKGLL